MCRGRLSLLLSELCSAPLPECRNEWGDEGYALIEMLPEGTWGACSMYFVRGSCLGGSQGTEHRGPSIITCFPPLSVCSICSSPVRSCPAGWPQLLSQQKVRRLFGRAATCCGCCAQALDAGHSNMGCQWKLEG